MNQHNDQILGCVVLRSYPLLPQSIRTGLMSGEQYCCRHFSGCPRLQKLQHAKRTEKEETADHQGEKDSSPKLDEAMKATLDAILFRNV